MATVGEAVTGGLVEKLFSLILGTSINDSFGFVKIRLWWSMEAYSSRYLCFIIELGINWCKLIWSLRSIGDGMQWRLDSVCGWYLREWCAEVDISSKYIENIDASIWSKKDVTAVGFEPTPFQTSALNWRLRPLGQAITAWLSSLYYS